MPRPLDEAILRLRILLLLGVRSLLAHRVKSSVVGSMLMFGTFLSVSGSALFDSLQAATARSVTLSLAGDLQVYSEDAPDRLALFGGVGLGSSDIGELPEISELDVNPLIVRSAGAGAGRSRSSRMAMRTP